MNKSTRKAIIAGNWKMNKTRPEAKELLEAIKPLVANAEGNVEVIACVPFTNLETAINATAGSNVKIGAENVHFEKSGSFTVEISAVTDNLSMLLSVTAREDSISAKQTKLLIRERSPLSMQVLSRLFV